MIATKGTFAAGFFQQRLVANGYRCIECPAADFDRLVLPAIDCVKHNDLDTARDLLETAVTNLTATGAAGVILACTELPIVIDRLPPPTSALCVDATRALATGCVAWWQNRA